MSKRQPKFDAVLRDVRVRVYATRSEYEVIFNDDDIDDAEANVILFPKSGPPSVWAEQGRLEYDVDQAKP